MSGSGPLPMLNERPGSRSESSTSTRFPRRAWMRAIVPASTDLPAPPLPTTAIFTRATLSGGGAPPPRERVDQRPLAFGRLAHARDLSAALQLDAGERAEQPASGE